MVAQILFKYLIIKSFCLVLGINETCGELDDVDNLAWLNEYVIQGEFGLEKEKHEIRGQIVAKAKYGKYGNYIFNSFLNLFRSHNGTYDS